MRARQCYPPAVGTNDMTHKWNCVAKDLATTNRICAYLPRNWLLLIRINFYDMKTADFAATDCGLHKTNIMENQIKSDTHRWNEIDKTRIYLPWWWYCLSLVLLHWCGRSHLLEQRSVCSLSFCRPVTMWPTMYCFSMSFRLSSILHLVCFAHRAQTIQLIRTHYRLPLVSLVHHWHAAIRWQNHAEHFVRSVLSTPIRWAIKNKPIAPFLFTCTSQFDAKFFPLPGTLFAVFVFVLTISFTVSNTLNAEYFYCGFNLKTPSSVRRRQCQPIHRTIVYAQTTNSCVYGVEILIRCESFGTQRNNKIIKRRKKNHSH